MSVLCENPFRDLLLQQERDKLCFCFWSYYLQEVEMKSEGKMLFTAALT